VPGSGDGLRLFGERGEIQAMAPETCTITFTDTSVTLPGGKDLRDGLSAAAVVEKTLFLASDEATRIERLTGDVTSGVAAPTPFALKDLIGPLPIDKDKEEVDIEGLAIHDNWLWLVGSHGSKREKIDLDDGLDTAANVETIAKVKPKGNRYL